MSCTAATASPSENTTKYTSRYAVDPQLPEDVRRAIENEYVALMATEAGQRFNLLVVVAAMSTGADPGDIIADPALNHKYPDAY